MKYENYKIEDMTFNTKEDWTEEEMREFLETCPEGKETEKTIATLEQLIKDIEYGLLKTNAYGKIIGTSGKAYANKHDYIEYGITSRWAETQCVYVYVDGEKRSIRDSWDAKRCIEHLKDVPSRFKYPIQRKYKETEQKWKEQNEDTIYKAENRDRILASRIANAWMEEFRVQIPTSIKKNEWNRDEEFPEYKPVTKILRGWDYTNTNKYGELKFFNTPITEEDAKRLTEACQEASRKIELAMDKLELELREMKEKYREG